MFDKWTFSTCFMIILPYGLSSCPDTMMIHVLISTYTCICKSNIHFLYTHHCYKLILILLIPQNVRWCSGSFIYITPHVKSNCCPQVLPEAKGRRQQFPQGLAYRTREMMSKLKFCRQALAGALSTECRTSTCFSIYLFQYQQTLNSNE